MKRSRKSEALGWLVLGLLVIPYLVLGWISTISTWCADLVS